MAREPYTVTERLLEAAIAPLGRVIVAYSGGVDSAVVLAAASRVLRDDVLAVTASSASVAQGEVENAVLLAREIGVAHEIIETREFDDPRYRANAGDRCYYCKAELYSALSRTASRRGYDTILDGTNADDGKAALDQRPGHAAARKFGVRSPLAEIGIGKVEVRAIAARYGLRVADKPATPCLSSRVPHGTRIEIDDLRRIDLAERYLRASGFPIVRVRHFGTIARVEVPLGDVDRLRGMEERAGRAFAAIGYEAIDIDARGYRTGSLNESPTP